MAHRSILVYGITRLNITFIVNKYVADLNYVTYVTLTMHLIKMYSTKKEIKKHNFTHRYIDLYQNIIECKCECLKYTHFFVNEPGVNKQRPPVSIHNICTPEPTSDLLLPKNI